MHARRAHRAQPPRSSLAVRCTNANANPNQAARHRLGASAPSRRRRTASWALARSLGVSVVLAPGASTPPCQWPRAILAAAPPWRRSAPSRRAAARRLGAPSQRLRTALALARRLGGGTVLALGASAPPWRWLRAVLAAVPPWRERAVPAAARRLGGSRAVPAVARRPGASTALARARCPGACVPLWRPGGCAPSWWFCAIWAAAPAWRLRAVPAAVRWLGASAQSRRMRAFAR